MDDRVHALPFRYDRCLTFLSMHTSHLTSISPSATRIVEVTTRDGASVRRVRVDVMEGRDVVNRWRYRTLVVVVSSVALLAFPAVASANSTTGANSVIAGGAFNTINAADAFIGTGVENTVTGDRGFIGAGEFNTASGTESGILAGDGSQATALDSSVVGGFENVAAGTSSIAGGANSSAGSDNSIALGGEAIVQSTDTGSVVLADGEGASDSDPCTSTAQNELTLCFTSVRIVFTRDSSGNPTEYCDISSGSVSGPKCPLAQSPTVVATALRAQQREQQLARKVSTLERQVKLLLQRTAKK
jgi:hypothetical protein